MNTRFEAVTVGRVVGGSDARLGEQQGALEEPVGAEAKLKASP